MKTADALTYMGSEITLIADAWREEEGTTDQHILEKKSESDKLYALNKAVRRAATICPAETLITDSDTGTDPVFTKFNDCQYIREPAWLTNAADEDVDIDEALCFGVIYNAIYLLDKNQTEYLQKADNVYRDFSKRYKDWLVTQPDGSACP